MTKKTKKTVFIVLGLLAVSALAYFLFFRNKSGNETNQGGLESEIPTEVQKLARDFEDGETLSYGDSIYEMYSGGWVMRG